jgi:glutathione S-transferase
MMVPWLADPNTGIELFESADIVAYLEDTYALDARVEGGS